MLTPPMHKQVLIALLKLLLNPYDLLLRLREISPDKLLLLLTLTILIKQSALLLEAHPLDLLQILLHRRVR